MGNDVHHEPTALTVRQAGSADASALARLRWRWRTDELGEPAGDREAFEAHFAAWVVDHLDTHLPFLAETVGPTGSVGPTEMAGSADPVGQADPAGPARPQRQVEPAAQPVGMAWLMLADRVPSPALSDRRTGDIQAVYVVPESRDSGVGGALLTAVLAEARDLRLEHMTVHSSERAVPFYLRHNFHRERRWLEWRP